MERGKELYKEKLISDRDLEDLEFAKENAAASLEQLEASYNVSLTNLKNCKIYSPVEGVVISRKIDVGQTVAASFQAPTLFVIGKDLSKMQIEVNIDEADIGRIKESQKVKFDVDAYPEETFWGKITQVRLEPVIVSNVVTYTVIVGVENSERKLKPGMTANVSVIEDSRKNVLKIPVAAARFRLSDELKAKYADESGPTNDNSKDNKINNEITAKGAGQVPANFKNLPADMPKNTSHFSRKLTGFSMNGNNGGEAKVSMRKIWLLKDNGKLEQIKIVLGISDGDFIEIVKGKITEKDKIVTEVLKDGKPLVQEENGFRLPMGGRH
jgi:HlyD family secretion protein